MSRRNIFLYSLLLCSLLCTTVNAQKKKVSNAYIDSMLASLNSLTMGCGVDAIIGELRKKSDYLSMEIKANAAISYKILATGTPVDTVVLPVVFHIVSTNPAGITDVQVTNALKDLNDAFSKSGNYAASAGADTRIRFALAKKDPSGGSTNGIVRVKSFYSQGMNMYTEDGRLKNLVQWDPTKYINVWVVASISGEISNSFSCGTWTRLNAGGYATIPSVGAVGTSSDGIVVSSFGTVLAHEMGHYLGLYHTFEGGCKNDDCTTDGDRVCDTPPDGVTFAAPSCNNPTNSCFTDTLSKYSNGFFKRDTTDQISNFMDYGNNACSNQFTEGQSQRMRAAIAALRPGLLTTGLTVKPCAENSTALFTRSIDYPVAGDLINFTNASSNATNYAWLVNDSLVATTQQFSRTFPTVGKTKITLKAYNSDPNCYAAYSDYIITNCGVVARFNANKASIASQLNVMVDTIKFTNLSLNADSYQWIITNFNGTGRTTLTSNAAGGGVNDLNYVFPTPGNYLMKLIATNTGTGCVDSAGLLSIAVYDPTPDAYINLISVTCYQETKVKVQFFVCDLGYKPLAANTKVSFYDTDPRTGPANKIDQTFLVPDSLSGNCCGFIYTQILDVKYPKLNQIYAAVNDAGNVTPIQLPNTGITEKLYTNNVAFLNNIRYKVSVNPSVAIMLPGNTLPLAATTTPDATASSRFLWSPASNLSCTSCATPIVTADSNTTKRVIATSANQCFDTAYVTITIPTDDYVIKVNSTSCSPNEDSIFVDFNIKNQFATGIIPKNLIVSFYSNDPSLSSTTLLPPVFKVPDSALTTEKNYRVKIKKLISSNLFASVNDDGKVIPVQTIRSPLPEKDYSNNFTKFAFQPFTTIDTAICTGVTYAGYGVSGTYTDNFKTKTGCDSVRILHLTVKQAALIRTTIPLAICDGTNYFGYTKPGTYIDTYKGTNTCDSIRTLILSVNPIKYKTNIIQICRGETYLAAGVLQTNAGTYIDTFRTTTGCDSIVTTQLTVNEVPANFLPLDTVLCQNSSLHIQLNDFNKVTWSTGSTSFAIKIEQPGNYVAEVVDKNGCTGWDTISVLYKKCIPVQVPNAFSPNSDGRNDVFKPLIGIVVNNYHLQIWNRWGQLLFETHTFSEGWNGRYNGEIQSNGTYVFFISFLDLDGNTYSKTGSFVLIK